MSPSVFVVVEHRSRTPMMPLSIFRSRSFSGANALTFLLYMAFGGALYFLPLNLIQVQGYSALAAGAATLPFILLMFFLSGWSGGLADRYGPKKPLVIGPSIVGVGLVLMAVPEIDSNYWVTFFPGIAVLGFGLAVTVAPLTMTVMGSVSKQRAGLASGINNAVSRTAGLVAIAALGPIIFAVFKAQLVDYLNALDLSNAVLQAFEPEIVKLGGAQPPVNIPGNIADDIRHAVDRAFVAGFRTVMWITAALAVLSTITATLFIEHKTSPETTPQLSKGEST